jgi:hypothetical protein
MTNRTQSGAKASPAAIQKTLKGMHYPAGRQQIISHAGQNNAPEDVLAVLNRLPEETWHGPADLMKTVGRLE